MFWRVCANSLVYAGSLKSGLGQGPLLHKSRGSSGPADISPLRSEPEGS